MREAFRDWRQTCREEFLRLLAAVQYFTRLPVPRDTGHSPESLRGAVRYLPLVGLLVGVAGAAAFLLARAALPAGVALLFSMAATVVVTGALHEDGLADAADGLGGGITRVRALEIMKDPRIGVFGAASLMLALMLKFQCLLAMPVARLSAALIAGHALSRLAAVCILATLPYVQDDDRSRAKPLITCVSRASLGVAVVTGLAPLPLVGRCAFAGLGCVAVAALGWRRYIRRRLGGCTGDCLGAAQQLTELSFYLGLLAAAR